VQLETYGVITNDVSDYISLLVRIAHIICNHPLSRKTQTITRKRAFRLVSKVALKMIQTKPKSRWRDKL